MTEIERRRQARPFFSMCIPQHNRTSFLIEVCRSLDEQVFRDFEVCISDDGSTDGRENELLTYLQRSGLAFAYRRQERNLRYDGNLRSAISMAQGEYCFLLGNDDALKSQGTLRDLHASIAAGPHPVVVITNFEDFSTGHVTRRVRESAAIEGTPNLAAGIFRKFSFVSGVILKTADAQALGDGRWDGSEMHQMFVGCRLIAAGGCLLELDQVTVRKDVQIEGERVDSYALRPRQVLKGIPPQHLPLGKTAMLVVDAIEPHIQARRTAILLKVIAQYLGFLYPYWLVQYRKVQSWRYAAGLSRGMHPSTSLSSIRLSVLERLIAHVVFGVSTVVGLTLPIWLLDRLQPPARRVATWVGGWRVSPSRT
ncbi:MAG: glycosyltransferase family 2 protein [Acidobacteriota bacterium]